jgi:hypothetical protein
MARINPCLSRRRAFPQWVERASAGGQGGGRVLDGSMELEGSSGNPALDCAAGVAIPGSSHDPLPCNFQGSCIEMRALFLYIIEPPQ